MRQRGANRGAVVVMVSPGIALVCHVPLNVSWSGSAYRNTLPTLRTAIGQGSFNASVNLDKILAGTGGDVKGFYGQELKSVIGQSGP